MDLRFSWRLLPVQPGLAALAVAGIGLASGTATAAFTVIGSVFLTALPVPGGDQIVFVWDRTRADGNATASRR